MALKDNPHDMKAPYHPGQMIRITTDERVFEGKVTLCNRVGVTDAWLLTLDGSHFSYVVLGKSPKLANKIHQVEILDESFDLGKTVPKSTPQKILTTEFKGSETIVQNVPRVVHNLTLSELRKALRRDDFSSWDVPDKNTQVVGQFRNGDVVCIWELVGFASLS